MSATQQPQLQHLRERLVSGIAALAEQTPLGLADSQVDQLLQFVVELQQWNRAYNLTAVRDPVEMIDRHVLDSLAVLSYVAGQSMLDVGAGAGLPGIPLAVARPEMTFTLLDSNGKKVRFMRHVGRVLDLKHVVAVQERIENFAPATSPDCIVARAFAPIERFVGAVAHLCRPGGRILAMRGRDEPFDCPDGFKLLENRTLKVPRSAAPRHLIILEREK